MSAFLFIREKRLETEAVRYFRINRLAQHGDQNAVRDIALADENVKKFIEGKPVRKVIYVPGKLANLVV